ncbi:MAG: hypothetical protein ACI4B5_07605 [Bacteroidaceae bacterium]
MNKNYQDPFLEEEEDDDNEIGIDWSALVKKFLQHRRYIMRVTFVFGILGCVVALTSKRTYTVQVMLAPEVTGTSRAGTSLKSLTSLLGVGNLSFNTSNDALNITLFPEICGSTPFLSQLFNVTVTPKTPIEDEETDTLVYKLTLYDYLSGRYKAKSALQKWKENIFTDSVKEPEADTICNSYFTKKQAAVLKTLQKIILADVDSKTGVTSITVKMTDPKIAQMLADTVCERLQQYVVEYRIKKTYQDYVYYKKLTEEAEQTMIKAQAEYAASVDYDRSVILQSVNSEKQRLQQEAQLAQEIYSQMKQQEVLAEAKIQEAKPVFAVLQPAVEPLKPSNSRKKVVLAFMFVGFCLSSAWKMIIKENIQKLRALAKETE